MMDYSYIPQLYQQGLENGLGRQFTLASQAQPVTQFLKSLQEKTILDRQQQQADTQQAREEAWAKSQEHLRQLGMLKELDNSMDGTKEGYESSVARAKYFGIPDDAIAKPKENVFVPGNITQPGNSIGNLSAPAISGFEKVIRNKQAVDATPTVQTETDVPTLGQRSDIDPNLPLTPGTATLGETGTVYPKGAGYGFKEMVEGNKMIRNANTVGQRADAANMTHDYRMGSLAIRDRLAKIKEGLAPIQQAKMESEIELIKATAGLTPAKQAELMAQVADHYAGATLKGLEATKIGLDTKEGNYVSPAAKLESDQALKAALGSQHAETTMNAFGGPQARKLGKGTMSKDEDGNWVFTPAGGAAAPSSAPTKPPAPGGPTRVQNAQTKEFFNWNAAQQKWDKE
jgi:hypothetical protein